MPPENPSGETRAQRGELILIYVLCVALLGAMGFLWLQQNGYFGSAPAVSHTPEQRVARPIDLNSAPWWELTQIKGIGKKRAEAIVELRKRKCAEQKKRKEEEVGFTSLDELKEIRGITSEIIERMRAVVRVTPQADDEGKQR